jgi:hypothetical protein
MRYVIRSPSRISLLRRGAYQEGRLSERDRTNVESTTPPSRAACTLSRMPPRNCWKLTSRRKVSLAQAFRLRMATWAAESASAEVRERP